MAPKLTVPKAQKLSILLLFGAVVVFYFLVEYGTEPAKVDENAVGPETVSPTLVQDFIKHYDFNEHSFRSQCKSANQSQSIKEWISTKWNQYSIENHEYNNPSSSNASILYGVHRSPFSDGKTATVVAMTYDLEDVEYSCSTVKSSTKGLSSITTFMTMAYALSTAKWCSKDIIFVMIERRGFNYRYQQNQLSIHKHPSYHLFQSFVDTILPQYTSVIVGGLVLEMPLYSKSSALAINVAGPLGFQPNYDIVATTLIAFRRNHFEMTVSPYWSHSIWNSQTANRQHWNTGDELRKSMIRSMAYQSIGKSNGYHGALVKHRIDAVSVVSYDYYNGHFILNDNKQRYKGKRSRINKPDQAQINRMFGMGHSMELFVRSMSNLIEVFHHSTFNYIVISESKFITMAKYSIPIGLLGAAPLIEAYTMYSEMYTQFMSHLVESVVTLVLCVLFGVHSYFAVVLVDMILAETLDHMMIGGAVGFMLIFGVILVLKWRKYASGNGKEFYVSFMVLLSLYALLSQIWLPIALNFSCGLYFVTVTVAMLFVIRKRAVLEEIKVDDDDKWEKAELVSGLSEGVKGLTVDTEITKKDDANKPKIINKDNTAGTETKKDEDKDNDKAVPVQKKYKTVINEYSMKMRIIRIVLLSSVPFAAVYGILMVMDMQITELIDNLQYDLLREDIYDKHPGWIVFFCTIVPTFVGSWSLLVFSI